MRTHARSWLGSTLLGLCALVAASAAEGTPATAQSPEGRFAGLYFVDVGQGSCLLVVGTDGTTVVVDAGPPSGAEAVISAMRDTGLERVDLWALTHFDTDHVGGLGRVIDGPDQLPDTPDDLRVDAVWDRGDAAWPDTPAMRAYAARFAARREAPADGARFVSGTVSVEVIATSGPDPQPIEHQTENERGNAYCIEVDGHRVLAPGDLPAARVVEALARCPDPEVIWVSHHGATDGTSPAVVAASDDAVAVITAGHRNVHCHPDPLTLATWSAHRVYVSDTSALQRAEACGEIVGALGPEHHVVADDLAFPTTPQTAGSTSVSGLGNAVTLGAW